jgi:hypothetical protein
VEPQEVDEFGSAARRHGRAGEPGRAAPGDQQVDGPRDEEHNCRAGRGQRQAEGPAATPIGEQAAERETDRGDEQRHDDGGSQRADDGERHTQPDDRRPRPSVRAVVGRRQRGKRRRTRRHRERPQHPRRHRVREKAAPPAARQRVVGHGDRRVDDENDDPRRDRAERPGQAIGADEAEREGAENEDLLQQPHPAEQQRAREPQQPEGRRRSRARPEAAGAPVGEEQAPERGRTAERRELADRRQRAGKQRPRADDKDEYQRGPHRDLEPHVPPRFRPVAVAEKPGPVVAAELAAEETREPRVSPRLQAANLAVRPGTVRAHLAALGADLAQVPEVRAPRAGDGPRRKTATDEERVDRLADVEHRDLRQHANEMEPAVVLEDRPQPVTDFKRSQRRPPALLAGPQVAGHRLDVADARRRRDQHAAAGDLGAPAQVEVFAQQRHPGVVAADRGEQVGADQREPARYREDVADGVVLLLVELAPLDRSDCDADLVGAQAHLQQPARVIPLDQLRPHDRGVGAERLLEQQADGVGIRRHVVVAEDVVRRALDDGEDLVGRGGEAGVAADPPHERAGRGGGDPGRHVSVAHVDDQDRQVRVVLHAEGRQRLLEPRAGIAGDDDGDDGRGRYLGLVVEVLAIVGRGRRAGHFGARLAVRPAGSMPVPGVTRRVRSACNCLTTGLCWLA